jgi:hypothetical protein
MDAFFSDETEHESDYLSSRRVKIGRIAEELIA